MREHRSSNAGEQDVQATNQGGRVKRNNISFGNLTVNIDTSELQATIEDAKWQMKPPIKTISLSIGGRIRFKGDKSITGEITMRVSKEMKKALKEELK